jgi:hypothetical protein
MRGTTVLGSSFLELGAWEDMLKLLTEQTTKIKILCVTERKKPLHTSRTKVPYYREDFEIDDGGPASHSDAKRIQAPQAEIMFGGAGDAIDRLSSMDRMLYEASEFIVAGGADPSLFRMRDEIGALRATIKKRNAKGELVPTAFAEAGAGGMDLDAAGLFDPEADLVDMVNKYGHAKWVELKRDQRTNEYQRDAWQTHAPALLVYIADIVPDHPMEAASPILLEPEGQVAQVFVPEHESRAVLLLHGEVNMYIVDEGNIDRRVLESTIEVTEIDGPCHIIFEPLDDAIEDALLIVGKPVVDPERMAAIDDLQVRAMASPIGYQDSTRLSQSPDILIDDEEIDYDIECIPEDMRENAEFGLRIFQGRLGILPDINELGSDIPNDWEQQVKLYQKETAGTISLERWRVAKKLRKLEDELTTRLDSAYLGHGYVPPMLRWEKILEEEHSSSVEAAERRIEMAEALLKFAKRVDTLPKMQEFRERLFKMNQADKALANLWSPKTMLEPAKLKFKNKLAGERFRRVRCNICGTTFVCAPKYATYLAAYKYAVGHEIAELTTELEQAKQNGAKNVAKIEKQLKLLNILPSHAIKCYHKHDPEAERMLGDKLYTILQDDPLTAVRTNKRDAKGNLIVENTLRKKTWHWFERRRQNISPQMQYRIRCLHCDKLHDRVCAKDEVKQASCPACGTTKRLRVEKSRQLTKPEFRDDSRWWKDRTEAFEQLNATQAQWNTIYKQLWIQQDRMQQCFLSQGEKGDKTPLHERKAAWKAERDMAWDALKTAFQACTTLHDLLAFERSLTHQIVADRLSEKEQTTLIKEGKSIPQPGDIIRRSPLDRLTFGDEKKIRVAIEQRRTNIAHNCKASAILDLHQPRVVEASVNCAEAETCGQECWGRDSIEAWCYKCNKPSIGKPKLGLTEKDKGFLFIDCITEGCGCRIAIGAHHGPRSCGSFCPTTKY